jgi:hypothetical protein
MTKVLGFFCEGVCLRIANYWEGSQTSTDIHRTFVRRVGDQTGKARAERLLYISDEGRQALVLAEQESPYKQIYNSTLGIIFFGTPHQGSNLANYATTITRTLLVLAKKPNAELLESLRKGGPALKQLSEDWKAHHERMPYQIVSFYETRTMKGLRSLVSLSARAVFM